jgi:hypothetical protein
VLTVFEGNCQWIARGEVGSRLQLFVRQCYKVARGLLYRWPEVPNDPTLLRFPVIKKKLVGIFDVISSTYR